MMVTLWQSAYFYKMMVWNLNLIFNSSVSCGRLGKLPIRFYNLTGASLVAHWLRVRLPMQGTQVRALFQEDPTCRGANKPMSHNYWAWVPRLLRPAHLEPVLRNGRSHRNERPAHLNKESPPLTAIGEKPVRSGEDPTQPKINKYNK